MWIKPVLEVNKATIMELYSIDDPELDLEATPKTAIKAYSEGVFSAASEFVFKGEPTKFVCRPLTRSEYDALLLEASVRFQFRNIEGVALNVAIDKWAGMEAFKLTCLRVQCGKEIVTKNIVDSVPLNVRMEIGGLVLFSSTNVHAPL